MLGMLTAGVVSESEARSRRVSTEILGKPIAWRMTSPSKMDGDAQGSPLRNLDMFVKLVGAWVF